TLRDGANHLDLPVMHNIRVETELVVIGNGLIEHHPAATRRDSEAGAYRAGAKARAEDKIETPAVRPLAKAREFAERRGDGRTSRCRTAMGRGVLIEDVNAAPPER